ncbi:MAG: SCO family protein [Aggregatilineaceae bacterium]
MRRWLGLLMAGALLSAALVACGGGGDGRPTATPLPGTLLDPPKEVGDFTLTDQDGQPFRLSDLRGKVALLFFGYTNCPDVCPTTLAEFKRIKVLLGEDVERVAFVFVSVDGARDTPERLAAYVRAFDPQFIGLTGDDATLRPIARDFGVFYQRVNYESDVNYLVDHTASTFVVDQQGRLRLVFPYGTDPAAIVTRLRALW